MRYFERDFYHFTILWFKNAKFNFLKKIKVSIAFINRIEVHVIANPSSRLA